MAAETLAPDLVEFLLSTSHADITMQYLRDNFAATTSNARIPTGSTFTLSNAIIAKHKNLTLPAIDGDAPIVTTAGRFITNFFLLGGSIAKHFSYINTPWNNPVIKGVQKRLAISLIENKITPEEQADYINREEWFGFGTASFMAPSMNMNVVIPIPAVMKRKRELLEEHKDAIARMDMAVISKIEKELIDMATEALKDDPALELYTSGTKTSMANNYKTTTIMTGSMVESNDRSKFTFSSSNLSDGIQMDEMHRYADQQISVAFDTAISTRDGGYVVKQFVAAFSHVVLDEPGSDCKTKHGLNITIDKDSLDNYHLRNVVHEGKIILLTEENIKKLQGKTVRLRSPMYCLGSNVCSKCAGEFYYRLGTKNIGGFIYKIGSNLLQAALKNKHDKTIKTKPIDIVKALKSLD